MHDSQDSDHHADGIAPQAVNAIRFLSIDAVDKANSGHPGAPMGLAPTAYTLWTKFLRHSPKNPEWINRDRFVLSAGHASMLLYSILHLTGYDLSIDEIKNFRQWQSKTPGHPEYGLTPGVEATTGPLGQGFANAVGFAIAEKILADTYNTPRHNIIDHRTYVICSDGDMMEGVASEAASIAGTLQLGKLIVIYDDNDISIEGDTDKAFREDVAARFQAYGFQNVATADGNDLQAIEAAIQACDDDDPRPKLVTVRSIIGYGSPNLAGTGAVHGKAMGADETAATRQRLGWHHPPFHIPQEIYQHMRQAVARGSKSEDEWNRRLDDYAAENPELARALSIDIARELPAEWDADLEKLIDSYDSPTATRAVSGHAIHAITPRVPRLIGGSADLAESNNTEVQGRGSFSPENPSGRNLHFGVREHAMGAVSNGMALHKGITPYAATFLIFSDYLRPAIRVGALSHAPAIWIFTHDSIGLGEDGPTHQPVSQLMALRMVPNLTVIRPADPNETIAAWHAAMQNRHAPTALILTRQNLPPTTYSNVAPSHPFDSLKRGAYSVVEPEAAEPRLIIIATGSEVQLATAAAIRLNRRGIHTRAISMPSWELFEAQPEDYRHALLPPSVRARISVEAGATIGWQRYTGLDGISIGIDTYGASAPGDTVMHNYGFTPENVIRTAETLL